MEVPFYQSFVLCLELCLPLVFDINPLDKFTVIFLSLLVCHYFIHFLPLSEKELVDTDALQMHV